MDQMMVDVTDIADVCPGDEVTLIGRDGAEMYHARGTWRSCPAGLIMNLSAISTRESHGFIVKYLHLF